MEKSHFLGDWGFFMWFLVILLVGTGEPLLYCNKNTLGKIEFEFEFGIGRPPLQSGQKTKFFDRFNLRSPLSEHLVVLGVWWENWGAELILSMLSSNLIWESWPWWHPWSCHVIRDYIFVVAVLLLLLRFKENHLTSWTPFVTKPFPQYQETPPMCCLWCLRCQQCLTVRNQTLLVTTVNGRLSRKY